MDRLYVGIDVANASFVAAAQGPAGEGLWGEFANTPAGFGQRQGRVTAAVAEQNAQAVVVLEPTGGYQLALAGFAAAQGWQVSRPNALRVHDWANSQGRRTKTDRQDGRILAR
jgi:transposase